MKKIISACMALLLLCSCSNQNKEESSKMKPMRIGLLSSETSVGTYLIEITDDGYINVSVGTRTSDDIHDVNFLVDSTSKKRKLTEKEKKEIANLQQQIENTEFKKDDISFKDLGQVSIYYNQKDYQFYYNYVDSLCYKVKVVSSEEMGDDWRIYVVTMNCDTGNYYGTTGAGHYLVCYVLVSEENGEKQTTIPDYNVDAKTKSTFKKIVKTYKKDLKNYRALKE